MKLPATIVFMEHEIRLDDNAFPGVDQIAQRIPVMMAGAPSIETHSHEKARHGLVNRTQDHIFASQNKGRCGIVRCRHGAGGWPAANGDDAGWIWAHMLRLSSDR